MAMGAQSSDVLRMIARQAGAPLAAGLGLGITGDGSSPILFGNLSRLPTAQDRGTGVAAQDWRGYPAPPLCTRTHLYRIERNRRRIAPTATA